MQFILLGSFQLRVHLTRLQRAHQSNLRVIAKAIPKQNSFAFMEGHYQSVSHHSFFPIEVFLPSLED